MYASEVPIIFQVFRYKMTEYNMDNIILQPFVIWQILLEYLGRQTKHYNYLSLG